MAYRLNLKALDEHISIPEGTNLLIDGQAMIGKSVFARNIVYRALKKDQGVVLITSKETSKDVLNWYNMHNFDIARYSDRWVIIDCLTASLHSATDRVEDTDNIKMVEGTINLTKIMYHMENFVAQFHSRGINEVVIIVDSLSVFLMYSSLQGLFTFLHVFTGKIREIGGCGFFLIDSDMHDQRTMSTLKQLFQGTVEMRYKGEDTVLRVAGMSPQPTGWYRFVKGYPY